MGRNTTFRVGAIALVGLLISLMAFGARAQNRSTTGLQPLLPVVQPTSPRPLESEDESLSKEQRGPLAELLDSATTSDAVLEVIVGQSRILTTKGPIAQEGGIALVATGDPTVIDFEVAGPRLLRILGNKVGVTDLSITTDEGDTYTIDVHVVYDLPLLRAYLQQIYPDAQIGLKQLREHIVLEGQARSVEQISQIVQTLTLFLRSAQVSRQVTGRSTARGEPLPQGGAPEGAPQDAPAEPQPLPGEEPVPEDVPAAPSPIDVPGQQPRVRGTFVRPQIINLMRVPGVHQVMLKVQMAELNRTALREIGADMFFQDGRTALGTLIRSSDVDILGGNIADIVFPNDTTAFGVFDAGKFAIFLRALRSNGVSNILAEPNLVAMNGQEATFLAGGEIPVPVAQGFGAISIEYKQFGVQLNFLPTILDDETVRLRVNPIVSSLDFVNAVVIQGQITPALQTRSASTTVELKQGQTLALAGLLQVDLDASTARIPGLGDLPYLGPYFSSTRHERTEKELLVMVTPYLVSPMDPGQPPPMPGSEILDPKCCEFYLMNRIEGRTGEPYRSPTAWDDPCYLRYMLNFEQQQYCGPIGYSE